MTQTIESRVALAGATVSYGARTALVDADLAVAPGESMALIGPNGSGKTTALKLMAGLLDPDAGAVARSADTSIGYLEQHAATHDWMPLTVGEVVRMGRYRDRGFLQRLTTPDRQLVARCAERMSVGDLMSLPFGSLSGGQRQRVLAAQMLCIQPNLLLLDEPVTGLDPPSREAIFEMVQQETSAGAAVVLSTHDLEDARRCSQVALLDGRVVAAGTPEEVLRPDVLALVFGTARIRTDGAHVSVIDDHAHGSGHDH